MCDQGWLCNFVRYQFFQRDLQRWDERPRPRRDAEEAACPIISLGSRKGEARGGGRDISNSNLANKTSCLGPPDPCSKDGGWSCSILWSEGKVKPGLPWLWLWNRKHGVGGMQVIIQYTYEIYCTNCVVNGDGSSWKLIIERGGETTVSPTKRNRTTSSANYESTPAQVDWPSYLMASWSVQHLGFATGSCIPADHSWGVFARSRGWTQAWSFALHSGSFYALFCYQCRGLYYFQKLSFYNRWYLRLEFFISRVNVVFYKKRLYLEFQHFGGEKRVI